MWWLAVAESDCATVDSGCVRIYSIASTSVDKANESSRRRNHPTRPPTTGQLVCSHMDGVRTSQIGPLSTTLRRWPLTVWCLPCIHTCPTCRLRLPFSACCSAPFDSSCTHRLTTAAPCVPPCAVKRVLLLRRLVLMSGSRHSGCGAVSAGWWLTGCWGGGGRLCGRPRVEGNVVVAVGGEVERGRR